MLSTQTAAHFACFMIVINYEISFDPANPTTIF